MKIRRRSLMGRLYVWLCADAVTPLQPVSLCQFVAMVCIGVPIVVVMLAALTIVASPAILIEKLSERWRRRQGPARPWAVTEWLRAKKRRVCPMVELDEEWRRL